MTINSLTAPHSPYYRQRVGNLAAFIICAGMMTFALIAQYVWLMEPCPLCVFQRIALIVLGLVFFAGCATGAGTDRSADLCRAAGRHCPGRRCGCRSACLVAALAERPGSFMRTRTRFHVRYLPGPRGPEHGSVRFRRVCGSFLAFPRTDDAGLDPDQFFVAGRLGSLAQRGESPPSNFCRTFR